MWYLHCFDSPKKEVMLKTLMFKSLSDLARCVMIPRRIITQFYYARQTYNPVKASNIEWARHVLKHIYIQRTYSKAVDRRSKAFKK